MLKHMGVVEGNRSVAERAGQGRQDIMVRCVLDRMRAMARDSAFRATQAQEHVDAITRLHAQLIDSIEQRRGLEEQKQTLQVEVASLQTRLAAILHSRTYRLARAFGSLRLHLMPRGSLRERAAAVAFRALRRIRRGSLRTSSPVSPSTCAAASLEAIGRSPAVPVLPADTAAHLPKAANQAVAIDKKLGFSKEELDWLTHDHVGNTAYAPLTWPLRGPARSDTRFLDLVLLSPVHRSGSTLLQRICNSRKGTLIWGEHGGLLAHFANIYAMAAYFSMAGRQERVDYFSQGENPNLWIADMCPDLDYVQMAVVESARAFLRTFYDQYREQHDIIGFKEVHYRREELELIRACCPETEIVFLVRNPLDAWKSTPRSWYLSLDEWISRWKTNVQYFVTFAGTDAHCHLLRHEDVIRQEPKTLKILADVAKVSREQVSKVLAHKIGSQNAGIIESERATICERCREPMADLGYL
jgi:hypothetical protein